MLKKRDKNFYWYHISKLILAYTLRIFWRVRIFGKENVPDQPYIVTSNHASYIDPPLIGMACDKDTIDFMAKKELFDKPLLGAWCRLVGCVEVSRGSSSVRSLREALERIKRKRSVAIFPEGTRSEDGSLQEAKRGIGFLVARAGVPVLPIYIDGTAEAMAKGKNVRLGARINVYVGKPVTPEEFLSCGIGGKDYDSFANVVMDRIVATKEVSEKETVTA